MKRKHRIYGWAHFCGYSLTMLVAGCSTAPETAGCNTANDCEADMVCQDGRCLPGSEDAGADAPPPIDAGDAGPVCPSRIFCGTPPMCCADGDECIEGVCLDECTSGVRCGEDRTLCCGDSQVCLRDACLDPGAPCGDSFDCPEGEFCEPTLGACLPQLEPLVCEVRPTAPSFDAVVEWHWEGVTGATEFRQVLTTPMVADVDADGDADVVISAYRGECGSRPTGPAALVILEGRDGTELVTMTDPDQLLNCWAQLAVGNLDADPELEIVGILADSGGGGIIAFEADGSEKWRQTTVTVDRLGGAAPALADLDGDGNPEVVVSGMVLNGRDGTLIRDLGAMPGNYDEAPGAPMSIVADLDGDGSAEVVGGHRAVRHDGTTMWTATGITGGYPAVADFYEDGTPDIAVISNGQALILDGRDGRTLFGPIAIPGGGNGGAPTVADFDGDGEPEFAAAGRGRYAVYDPACMPEGGPGECGTGTTNGILWESVTQDLSSSITGSSVFDFEADGRAEVIYNDECFLRVYDGATGAVLLERANSSRTGTENPIVVDVDGDNNAEIIVPASDDALDRDGCETGVHGVLALGDRADSWVRTRRIWNQHSYHVTNISRAGEVPRAETPNWSTPGLNNYRQNVQGIGVFNAPDLVLIALDVALTGCPDTLTIRARVANDGSLGVAAGVSVAFRHGTVAAPGALIGTADTITALLPGASTVVEIEAPLIGMGPFSFVATADDDGTGAGAITECDEENNSEGIGDVDCDLII